MNFRIAGATHIGGTHAVDGYNNQDSLKLGKVAVGDALVYIGVVADGCSASVGSQATILVTDFVFDYVTDYLFLGKPLEKLDGELQFGVIEFLTRQCELKGWNTWDPRDREKIEHYIKYYWLSTILVFVAAPWGTLVLVNGDGVVRQNGEAMVFRSVDNKPNYLAFNAIPWYLTRENLLRCKFNLLWMNTSDVWELVIASDGWTPHIDQLGSLREWNDSSDILLLRVNALYEQGAFNDDATVVGVWKEEDGEPADDDTDISG